MQLQRLYLVDASVYVFRAYHSLDASWHDEEGWATHAVHGYASFLLQLLEQLGSREGIAVCFDEALESSFRNAIYPAYKANREPADEGLLRQFGHCQALTRALGVATLADPQYEADDLIGTLAAQAQARQVPCVIVSSDKDLTQLIGPADEQWDFARDRRWDAAGVAERFGVRPEQIADWLALTGDSVDNIPGIRGIGPTSASALLAHFGSLDALFARLEELPYLRMRGAKSLHGKLKGEYDNALLWRRLTAIATDAPVARELPWERLRPCAERVEAAADYCQQLGFGPLLRSRVRKAAESLG